jgi:membrane protein YdbS with pleckstrin-like domain
MTEACRSGAHSDDDVFGHGAIVAHGSIDSVDDLFAPAGTAWQPVSPKLATVRRILLLVFGGLLAIAVVALTMWLLTVAAAVALGVVSLGLVGWGWWLVGRSVASVGYAEHHEDLYIKHGVMFRRLVTVPYGRMQYVDVQAGPLDQLFDIAKVHLHTAAPGTSAVIPGVPASEAARLRDRLTSLGEAQAAGL